MFFKKEKFPTDGLSHIVVGLGNMGREYEGTRHNAGFMALDALAAEISVRVDRIKFKSLCATAEIGGQKVLLMKPSTYMNRSGLAVTEAMGFYKIPPEKVIVLMDDISLEPGRLRIRRKGSDGGHNGLKNILYLSGSDQFPRIKLGVGQKPERWDLADWVLSRFSSAEEKLVQEAADKAAEAVKLILSGQIDQAMNLYNS